jgi:hypothetical protein
VSAPFPDLSVPSMTMNGLPAALVEDEGEAVVVLAPTTFQTAVIAGKRVASTTGDVGDVQPIGTSDGGDDLGAVDDHDVVGRGASQRRRESKRSTPPATDTPPAVTTFVRPGSGRYRRNRPRSSAHDHDLPMVGL